MNKKEEYKSFKEMAYVAIICTCIMVASFFVSGNLSGAILGCASLIVFIMASKRLLKLKKEMEQEEKEKEIETEPEDSEEEEDGTERDIGEPVEDNE